MLTDMERVKKFVPTLKKVLEVYGVEETLDSIKDMIDNGGYSTISELQQGFEMDLKDLENDGPNKELDCIVCNLRKENACDDCCRDWDNENED